MGAWRPAPPRGLPPAGGAPGSATRSVRVPTTSAIRASSARVALRASATPVRSTVRMLCGAPSPSSTRTVTSRVASVRSAT
jgi:hypothetical protein